MGLPACHVADPEFYLRLMRDCYSKPESEWTPLVQQDFDKGTVRILRSGCYYLKTGKSVRRPCHELRVMWRPEDRPSSRPPFVSGSDCLCRPCADIEFAPLVGNDYWPTFGSDPTYVNTTDGRVLPLYPKGRHASSPLTD